MLLCDCVHKQTSLGILISWMAFTPHSSSAGWHLRLIRIMRGTTQIVSDMESDSETYFNGHVLHTYFRGRFRPWHLLCLAGKPILNFINIRLSRELRKGLDR